jgi:hypothetical protein
VSPAESQHAGVWNQRTEAAVAHARFWNCSWHLHEEGTVCKQYVQPFKISAAALAEAGASVRYFAT